MVLHVYHEDDLKLCNLVKKNKKNKKNQLIYFFYYVKLQKIRSEVKAAVFGKTQKT